MGTGGLTDSPDHSFPSSNRYRSSGSAMQDGALPSRGMKGKGPEGQYTEQSALWKAKNEKLWGPREVWQEEEVGKKQEAARVRWRSRSQRYHGRLQGRGLLGWAYETVFVVALWLRQENRWFSSSRVTNIAQI